MKTYRKFVIVGMVSLCGLLALGQAGNFGNVTQCLLSVLLYQFICCPNECFSGEVTFENVFDPPDVSFLPTNVSAGGAAAAAFYYLEVSFTGMPEGEPWFVRVGSAPSARVAPVLFFDGDALGEFGTGTATLEQTGINFDLQELNGDTIDLWWGFMNNPFYESKGAAVSGSLLMYEGFVTFDNDGNPVEYDANFILDRGFEWELRYFEADAFIDCCNDGIVQLANLENFEPSIERDFTYELWMRDGNDFTSLGRFDIDSEGQIVGEDTFAIDCPSFGGFELFITIEPAAETVNISLDTPFLKILSFTVE